MFVWLLTEVEVRQHQQFPELFCSHSEASIYIIQVFSFSEEIFFLDLVREAIKIVSMPLLIFQDMLDVF